jgi:phenylpropionate dioxygenase-like ring-hydroxylating dioxygenase large terminal subunit
MQEDPMFLRNAWYVAALDHEVTRHLFPIRILGEPVVLYRRLDGSVVGLEDACPHRKLPLSMGRLIGDRVECGYHGLTFDGTGTCTRVPGVEKIPHVARVRSYPVVERYGFVWIWTGDPALADASRIFAIEHWDDTQWGKTIPDAMTLDCNYLYVTDNLLDPSHVAWVHKTSFGNSACEEVPVETKMTETGVIVSRWMCDVDVAPFYRPFTRFAGNADRQQHYEVRYPCHAIIRAIFVPTGTGGPQGRLHDDMFLMDSYNFMSPMDERHTRYFWLQMRNFAPRDMSVTRSFGVSVKSAFEEDLVVLNAVQKGMDNKTTPNLDLKIDEGPLRFRKRLAQLITQEQNSLAAAE